MTQCCSPDLLFFQLGCCGVVNYKDWIRAQTQELPQSCCSVEKFPNGVCNSTLAAVAVCDIPTTNDCPIYVTGCADIILKNIEAHMGGIGGLGIAIAFIEVTKKISVSRRGVNRTTQFCLFLADHRNDIILYICEAVKERLHICLKIWLTCLDGSGYCSLLYCRIA